VGIIAAAILSIINDRIHAYVPIIKILTPIVAASYLAFLFAPPTHTVTAPYFILAILGAASFGLMPVVLEYVVEVTFPVSPEVTSTILWASGQFLGAIFLIIMGELKDNEGLEHGTGDYPPGNMQRALVFEAIICCLTAVLPFGLGMKALGLDGDRRKRFNIDESGATLATRPPWPPVNR
jgi:FLVCR family MFS transporter 7